jgi:hypothetical protein
MVYKTYIIMFFLAKFLNIIILYKILAFIRFGVYDDLLNNIINIK